jgi:hypothetical protein
MCLLITVFLSACSISTNRPPLSAVYLVQTGGLLPQADLDKHPEILVTDNFEVFKQATRNRIGLWVDKNSTQLVDPDWLNTAPQAYYPMIVIGYNDPLRSFKYNLQTYCFLGPVNPDFSDSEPGFSIFEKEPDNSLSCGISQGFKQTPTVEDVLEVSNALLEGSFIEPNIQPAPKNISTPTPPIIIAETP